MTGPRATVNSVREIVSAEEGDVAEFLTEQMRGATDTLKTAARDQILGAGLGQRLANTWRGETYPASDKSLDPAGYVWSRAPDIVTAFASGATIRPVSGHAYLWLPTKNVPPGSGRGASAKKMTPDQVLSAFRAKDFIIRNGKRGNKLAFIAQQRGTTARGARKRVTRGRIAHGDSGELVLMFVLTTSVKMPQSLDLDALAEEGASDFVSRVTRSDG